MSATISHYVPILKWRQAEYQSLLRLQSSEKDATVPLFVVPPIEYDFEERRDKETLQEHLSKFPDRYLRKWGERPAFVDLHESLRSGAMENGDDAVTYIFRELRSRGANAVPVLSRPWKITSSIRNTVERTALGIALRIDAASLMSSAAARLAREVTSKLGIGFESVDLILDLGKPSNFDPYNVFAEALARHINTIDELLNYRSFILAATAIDLSSVKKPGATLLRKEWLLYLELIKSNHALKRVPSFGDYTIETPEFAPDMDFRVVRTGARLVYTTDTEWLVQKGGAFRDNPQQMRPMCQGLVASGLYAGAGFSWGDKRILETAEGNVNTYGSPTTWKNVGINHHLCVVLHQLATLRGLPGSS